MTSLDELKAKAREVLGEPAEGYSHYNVDMSTVLDLIEATYNARTQEVVEIASRMKPYPTEPRQHQSYNDGKRDFVDDLITALTPVTVFGFTPRDPDVTKTEVSE